MKKLLLFISCFFATMSVLADAMYTYDESSKSYIYQGEPVSEFSVDFTTWETTALPDKIYDADGATENGNMAFVKWVIANRSIQMTPSETAVKKNVAFNKGKTDDDPPVTNKDTENKPRIYLPTTANGVKKITAHMAVASTSSRSLLIYYKDENLPDWTYVKDQAISIQTTNKYDVAEATYELNTVGKTSIYLQYNSTDFFCVLDIALDIEPIEYAYNETTQRYDYIGEPLEETLEVDFTQLLTTKKAFNTVLGTNVHADTCLEFEHVGLYKWCHNLDNRSCEGTTYTDVLSNYGNSDVNGTKTANNASDLAAELKPTVYLPTVKNGISKIIVEGWTNDNTSGNLYIQAKDVLTNTWKSINKVDGSITKSVFALGNNTYTKDTLVINNRNIKDVLFYRQHTPYQFITKITIIPMDPVEPEYVLNNTTGRYDYVGTPIEGEEPFEVNFNELTPYDVAYNTSLEANTFADEVVEFQHLGLYKYGYYEKRTCESVEYKPLLWNSGKSDYQGELKKNSELYSAGLFHKLPCIYSPTFKNGIKRVIIEGWSNNNARGLNLIAQKADGIWDGVKNVCAHADKGEGMMGGNTYTTLTFDINSNNVKNIGTWINCTDWQFITKITIVPMGNNEVVIEEDVDNKAVLTAHKDETVDLTIYRKLKAGVYNTFCLPCTLNVAAFKHAIDDEGCDVRYFSTATMEGGSLNLTFTNVSNIGPGFACLVKPTKDIEDPIVLENVTIEQVSGRNIARPNSTTPLVKFFSTLSPKDLAADENCLVLSGDNTLYFVDEAVTMKGLRGYFMLYDDAARTVKANKMPMRAIFPNDAPTDIEPMHDADCQMHNGKYLINGQFVIVREGKRYNVLGY